MAAEGYCSPVRPPPPPYSPPRAFSTNFQDKAQALQFFDEGWGQVTTAGSLACRRTDHLSWNQSFDGYGVEAQGRRGLRIVMDDRNASSCHRDSQVATGHLLTKTYLPASGGRIEMLARIGFGADPATGYRSADSFSCLGLYVHDSVSEFGYRNELSMCVSSADTRTVRMGYWVGDDGDRQHAKQATLTNDLAQGFHLYSIDWSPNHIRLAVDDAPVWVVDGTAMCAGSRAAEVDTSGTVTRLPFEPMSVRVILRPRGRTYFPPPTYMDVAHFSYTPAGGATAAAAAPDAVAAPDAPPVPASLAVKQEQEGQEQVQEKEDGGAGGVEDGGGVTDAVAAEPEPRQHAAVPAEAEAVSGPTAPTTTATVTAQASSAGETRRPSRFIAFAVVGLVGMVVQLSI